jgi:hypothetical protein
MAAVPAGAAPAVLRSPATVRERCRRIAAAVEAGDSAHFTVDRRHLQDIAARVARVTRARHAQPPVPPASVWRRLEAGGQDRAALLEQRLGGRTSVGAVRSRVDLAVMAALVSACAVPQCRHVERGTEVVLHGSEAAAVACFHAFLDGSFSSDAGDRCRVDAKALLRLDAAALTRVLRPGPDDAWPAPERAAALLHRLGAALRDQPAVFTAEGLPGHLFDTLTHHRHVHHLPHANRHHLPPATYAHHVSLPHVVEWLLDVLNGALPADVGTHRHAGDDGRVPFLATAQWLALSLVEPLATAGVQANHGDALTALAGPRHGGLLLDGGVLLPRDDGYASRSYAAGDEWVVEWRALTVALMDDLLPLVRAQLGDDEAFGLPQLMEGTRAAGREIAAEARADCGPPVRVAFADA